MDLAGGTSGSDDWEDVPKVRRVKRETRAFRAEGTVSAKAPRQGEHVYQELAGGMWRQQGWQDYPMQGLVGWIRESSPYPESRSFAGFTVEAATRSEVCFRYLLWMYLERRFQGPEKSGVIC